MEFALVLPVLILLMLASVELARFVFLHQKMDRVATTISDLVARAETINESQLADIFTAAGEVSTPFDLANRGVVIVSSVTNLDGEARRLPGSAPGPVPIRPRASSAPKARSPICPPSLRCVMVSRQSSPKSTLISRRSSAS